MASRRAASALRTLETASTAHPRLVRTKLWSFRQSSLSATHRPSAASTSSRFFSTTSVPNNGHGSVDPTEVSHFNALASSWWDPHGPSRLLHLMNQMRHPFIQRCLASQSSPPPSRLRYLDVGCGGGIFAESAARQPTTASVLGIDPTPEVLAVAEAHKRQDPLLMEDGRLTYKNIPIEQLPLDGEGFDVVSCFEVVEHVATPTEFLQQLIAHVRPGGWLVGSTIARTWTSWATTIVAAEDILRMVPKGTHDWNKYINDDELSRWFATQAGLESPRIMGVMYVPGLGWKEVPRSEKFGNYFFAVRKAEV